MQVRVMRTECAARGRRDTDAHARVRQLGAGGLRVLPGRSLPVRQLLLHRVCRTSTDTRSRPTRSRRSAMPRPASSGRCRLGRRAAGLQLHRAGLRPGDDPPATDRGPERHHVPRRAIATQHPVVQGWSAGSPARFDFESEHRAAGAPIAPHASSASNPSSRSSRATRTSIGARRACAVQRSDRVQHGPASRRSYSPDERAVVEGARTRRGSGFEHEFWEAGAQLECRRLLRPVRSDEAQPRGLQRLRGLRPADRLPPAGDDEREREARRTTATSTPCRTSRTSRRRLTSSSRARSGSNTATCAPRSATSTTRRGYIWGALAHALRRRRRRHARPGRPVRRRLRAAGRPLLDLAAQRAGGSTGDRDDPLANFFFGGFGNNYVDNGEAKRYREVLSMPGFEIDAIGGRTFAKSMLEWNLPPLRFESLGHAGVLRAVGAVGAVRDGAVDQLRGRRLSRHRLQRRAADRLADAGDASAADDAVVRVRARVSRMATRGRRRVHDLAQGPLMGAAAAARRSTPMILESPARAPVGLLPVVVFLAALIYFDSYKLVVAACRDRRRSRRRGGRGR